MREALEENIKDLLAPVRARMGARRIGACLSAQERLTGFMQNSDCIMKLIMHKVMALFDQTAQQVV